MHHHFRREAVLMWVIPGAIILIGIVSVLIGLIMLPAYRAAEESARRALLSEVCAGLARYYEQHRAYPASLSELSLTFPDGSAKSLRAFRYTQSDEQASVTVELPRSGKIVSCLDPAA